MIDVPGPEPAAVIAALLPRMLPLADGGRVGVALGGSRAKGLSDARSDYDFRVYADRFRGPELRATVEWRAFQAARRELEAEGIRIDGVWCRLVADIDRDLGRWQSGELATIDYDWTVWGYHLPTDIANQQVIADPDGVLADWKRRLADYPEPLRRAILEHFGGILRYWRGDYHYMSKVERGDIVFLAGLTAALVHAAIQVVFALNRAWYVGDGWNLRVAAGFAILPADFEARVTAILDPGSTADRLVVQRDRLMDLVDEVLTLASRHG